MHVHFCFLFASSYGRLLLVTWTLITPQFGHRAYRHAVTHLRASRRTATCLPVRVRSPGTLRSLPGRT